ncbi:hypothetical protein KAW64_16665 [bacterium]|nr:hypothetical protein [bacterium]
MTNEEKRLVLALHEIRRAAVDRDHDIGERLGIIDVLAFEGLRDGGGIDMYPSQLREELGLELAGE